MPDFKAKIEDNKCLIFNASIIAVIDYDDKKKIEGSLVLGENSYRVEQGRDKNIVILENGTEIIKFKFDYMWGGATLIVNGEATGYKITGKAFKKGTRLVDADNKDMVVVVTEPNVFSMAEFTIDVPDHRATDFLIAITLYYHIYASIGKTMMASGII